MNRILIFGTGSSADKLLMNVRKDVTEILGFLDNSIEKQGKEYRGHRIYAPAQAGGFEYDGIVIASVKYKQITEQLVGLGVPEEKIYSYFAFDHSSYDRFREMFYVEGMVYDELKNDIQNLTVRLQNMEYETADKIRKKTLRLPKILSIEESVINIRDQRLSVSRYGDGEFLEIIGKKIGFQKQDARLVERLKEVLTVPVEGHVVGLHDIYGDVDMLEEKYADYARRHMLETRSAQYELIDFDRVYYNAFITRFYSEWKNKEKSGEWFDLIKTIWEGKEVVIMEGDKTRMGIGNDLLDNVARCERILCPNEDAFNIYDRILEAGRSIAKDKLILIALGPTATVLAYDLAKEGYWAVDIGHVDLEYEWFLEGMQEHKTIIPGKYTNEVVGGNVVEDIKDQKYLDEIIMRVE